MCKSFISCEVVLDRKGSGAPWLLCKLDNVVVSCHTGTWEKDFIVIAKECQIDALLCFLHWPKIDMEGTYKELIKETEVELRKVMGHVRDMI